MLKLTINGLKIQNLLLCDSKLMYRKQNRIQQINIKCFCTTFYVFWVFVISSCNHDFPREKSGDWTGENGRQAGLWAAAKRYPYCMDNVSYTFKEWKILFCRSFVHISEMCMLLEFWFLIIYAKNTSCWTLSFFFLLQNIAY